MTTPHTLTMPEGLGRLPLFFSTRVTLFGNGFAVEVHIENGRVLCAGESDNQIWMYGVNPGGLAAPGGSEPAAFTAFRNALKLVLMDIAAETESFEDFKQEVERFVGDTNDGTANEWAAAVDEVRERKLSIVGLEKRIASSQCRVAISLKRTFAAADNEMETEHQLAVTRPVAA